uniref:F-box domain-containing protein n=1 Tax=Caenorhabditis tropicalis TaxID=1561998 RepID=A0A1I7UT84_9PELO
MPFPLLRLPALAIEEIVKNCDHKEILFLVQTSSRARRLISRHTKLHSIGIAVVDNASSSYAGIFYGEREIFRVSIQTWREQINSSWRFQFFVRDERNILVSLWKQKDTCIQEILDFLKGIFGIEEVSFKVEQSSSCQAVLILENCVSNNLNIGSVDWLTISGSDEMTGRFLMASKGATQLNFNGFYSITFRFNHFHLFRMDQLRIENATWITSEQVVALRNCKRIDLGFVWLDEPSINKILREYLENPGKMQEIRMSFPLGITLEEVVKGLDAVRIEESNGERAQKYWFNGKEGLQLSLTKEWMGPIVITRKT